jgi:hypothetical protein
VTTERHRCTNRPPVGTRHHPHASDDPTPDTWDVRPNGDRVCSHCTSMHPDDFAALALKACGDAAYGIEYTQFPWRLSVFQPGVDSDSEGAKRFHRWHAPANPRPDETANISLAIHLTRGRKIAAAKASFDA